MYGGVKLNNLLSPHGAIAQWDKKGSEKSFLSLSNPLKNHSDDSCCFRSVNAISINWVLFRIWTPSTLLSIHSNKSGGNRNATYSFLTKFTPFYNITQQSINNCTTMSTCINVCLTNEHMNVGGEMNEGDGMNERKEN